MRDGAKSDAKELFGNSFGEWAGDGWSVIGRGNLLYDGESISFVEKLSCEYHVEHGSETVDVASGIDKVVLTGGLSGDINTTGSPK